VCSTTIVCVFEFSLVLEWVILGASGAISNQKHPVKNNTYILRGKLIPRFRKIYYPAVFHFSDKLEQNLNIFYRKISN